MLNSTVIDMVILLAFTYFTGSLVLSAVSEALASLLKWRSKQLKATITNLFFDEEWKVYVKEHLLTTPQVQALMKNEERFPSYIPATSFVNAVMHSIHKNDCDGNLVEKIVTSNQLPASFRSVLATMIHNCNEDIQAFEEKLASFYDNAMNRATLWYKKKIKLVLLVSGFILAVLLNIDTVSIINESLKNKQALANSVEQISNLLPKISNDAASVTITDDAGNVILQTSTVYDTISVSSSGEQLKSLNNIQVVYKNATGNMLGYNKGFFKEWSQGFLLKLLGMLITAFALQLGADHWFNIMNKVVRVKSFQKQSTK